MLFVYYFDKRISLMVNFGFLKIWKNQTRYKKALAENNKVIHNNVQKLLS